MKKLIVLFFLVLSSNCSEREDYKIKVAYHPNMDGAAAVITAIKKGYFAEEGLEVELVKFTSGPPEIAAIISRDIQFGHIGFGAHTLAATGKVSVIIMNAIANSTGILTRKESGIDSVDKLKGKIIITQLGSGGETMIDEALVGASITKDDLTILNADMSAAMAAFIAGKVDAIAAYLPFSAQIKTRLGVENINQIFGKYTWKGNTSSWVATPDYIENNKEIVLKFSRAIYRAMDYRTDYLETEVVDWVAELIKLDRDTVAETTHAVEWMSPKRLRDMLDNGELRKLYGSQGDYFIQNNRITKDSLVPLEEYVRFDIMNEALTSLNY